MKKLLLLPLLILITSCTLGSTNTSTPVGQGMSSTYETELKQASSKIKDSEEFKSCMNMNVPMCIQSAGMQIAQREKSTEVCKELTTPEQQEACVFTITVINAEEKGDVAACGTLAGNYLAQCKKSITKSLALKTKNPQLCKELSSEESTDTSAQDECILNVVVSDEKTTADACSAIASESVKTLCTNMVNNRIPAPTPETIEPPVTQ